MNKKRLELYLNLIQALLECPEGKELALLQANEGLIEPELIKVMEQVATQLAAEGDQERANFLNYWAEKLGQALAKGTESPQPPGEEKRTQAYLNLISSLLNCPSGQESEIISQNRDLIDAGLVRVMEQVSRKLAAEGEVEGANCLQEIARQLAESLSSPSPSPSLSSQLAFLKQVLQEIQDSGGAPQAVYLLLQDNLEQLKESLAQVLRHWAEVAFPAIEPELARGLAALLVTFSDLLLQFPLGNRADNLEIALAGYESALPVFPRRTFPEQWATIQNNLGEAYCQRQRGERAENWEIALRCFQRALQIYSQGSHPEQWALVTVNLAEAYRHRLRGSRLSNLERAVAAYGEAWQLRFPPVPLQWQPAQPPAESPAPPASETILEDYWS